MLLPNDEKKKKNKRTNERAELTNRVLFHVYL